MEYQAELGLENMEIKCQVVYEGTEEEWSITVHGVQSQSKKIDYQLRKWST